MGRQGPLPFYAGHSGKVSEKATAEQRSEGREGGSHGEMWRKSIPGRGKPVQRPLLGRTESGTLGDQQGGSRGWSRVSKGEREGGGVERGEDWTRTPCPKIKQKGHPLLGSHSDKGPVFLPSPLGGRGCGLALDVHSVFSFRN